MTRTTRLLCHLAPVALSMLACRAPSPGTAPDDADSLPAIHSGVVISADSLSNVTGDVYTIVGRPFVERDSLHVTAQYGGGCRRHDFTLFASHVFMESNPVQSPIAISHRANGDMCKALLTRELRFGLVALRDAWRRAYARQSGTIVLRLRGYGEGIVYTF